MSYGPPMTFKGSCDEDTYTGPHRGYVVSGLHCASILGFDVVQGISYGPGLFEGSGLWAPILKVVWSGVIISFWDSEFGAHTRGP